MAVFDLEAVIKLTDQGFKQGLSKAGKAISTFGKVAGVAIGAGVTGVTALTTASVKAYADYEQLSGGVQKLFGNMGRDLKTYAKDTSKTMSEARAEWTKLEYAQNKVLKNASEAFRTTGMSANEYIESVTGFSAALVNSYGGDTVKAAQQADKAMRAISDNFNTFGGDIQSVQNAYQGFAKQNYTMLDNLKLGYGGTKTEMERLIADANEYAKSIGKAGDLSIDSFGDIVEAIDLVQQKQNIAGTTMREASKTISGSWNMTKAAWKNLVMAFSDKDADLSKYFDNLVTSAETAFNNILPVAEQAIKGIGQMFTDLAPVIGEKLPGIISSVLPDLVKSGASLVTSVLTGFATAAPAVVEAIPEVVKGIKDGFVASWPALKEAGGKLMEMAGEGIKNAGPLLSKIVEKVAEKVGPILGNIWDKAKEKLPGLTFAVEKAWETIKTGAGIVKDALSGIDFAAIFEGAVGVIQSVDSAIGTLAANMDTIIPIMVGVGTAAAGLWLIFNGGTIITSVVAAFGALKTAVLGVFAVLAANPIGLVITLLAALAAALITAYNTNDAFRAKVDAAWQTIKTTAVNVFNGVVSAVTTAWTTIRDGVSKAWSTITSAVSTAWENLKSGVVWDSITGKVAEAWSAVQGTVAGAWAGIQAAVSQAWETLKGGVSWASISSKASEAWGAFQGTISGAFTAIGTAISEAWEKVKGALSFKLPDITLGALPRLPKLSISGGFSIFPPSVPTISWNAKAMKNPYMFTDMTLFGAGEAGDEVLYGRTALMTDIRAGVASETDGLTQNLTAILEELRSYLPELARRPVVLNSGALVGGIGYDMDRQLGGYSDMGGRELSLA